MTGHDVNRLSGAAGVTLSVCALLTVVFGYAQHAWAGAAAELCQADEGTLAHLFQLTIVALAPTLLAFVATADRAQPSHTRRPLAIVAVALALAFGALYYGEHRLCASNEILSAYGRDTARCPFTHARHA